MKQFALGIIGLTIAVVGFETSSPLAAQALRTPPVQIDADSPEMMVLVRARPNNVMRRDLETARRTQDSAETAVGEMARAHEIVRGRIEVRKRESETLKARIDLAKKENNETESAALEREREAVNQHVQLLERLRDVYEAQRRYEESRRNHARASIAVFEREIQLANSRTDDTTASDVLMNSTFMDLQGQVLEAQRTRAERQQVMAERQKGLFERRARFLQAQVAWLSRQT